MEINLITLTIINSIVLIILGITSIIQVIIFKSLKSEHLSTQDSLRWLINAIQDAEEENEQELKDLDKQDKDRFQAIINEIHASHEKESEISRKVDTTITCIDFLINNIPYFKESYVEYLKSKDIDCGKKAKPKKVAAKKPVKKKSAVTVAKPFTKKEYDTILLIYTEWCSQDKPTKSQLVRDLNAALDRKHTIKVYEKVWNGKIDKDSLEG